MTTAPVVFDDQSPVIPLGKSAGPEFDDNSPLIPLPKANAAPAAAPQQPAQLQATSPRLTGQDTMQAAPQPGILERARESVANSVVGHTLQSSSPRLASALHLQPTESESSPTYQQDKTSFPQRPAWVSTPTWPKVKQGMDWLENIADPRSYSEEGRALRQKEWERQGRANAYFDAAHPIAANIVEKVNKFGESLTSPESLALAAAGPLGKLGKVSDILTGIFTAQSAKGSYDSIEKARKDYSEGNNPEAQKSYREIVNMLGDPDHPISDADFQKAWDAHRSQQKGKVAGDITEAVLDAAMAGLMAHSVVKGMPIDRGRPTVTQPYPTPEGAEFAQRQLPTPPDTSLAVRPGPLPPVEFAPESPMLPLQPSGAPRLQASTPGEAPPNPQNSPPPVNPATAVERTTPPTRFAPPPEIPADRGVIVDEHGNALVNRPGLPPPGETAGRVRPIIPKIVPPPAPVQAAPSPQLATSAVMVPPSAARPAVPETAAPSPQANPLTQQPAVPQGQQDGQRSVVQASTNPADLRQSAQEQKPTLENMASQVASAVPGAEVAGPRVKTPDSQENKEDRGKPSETNIDHLGARVVAPSPDAAPAVEQAIEGTLPVVSKEKIENNGLNVTQYGVQTGKPGEPNQVSELQVVPGPAQAAAMKASDADYDRQKEAQAEAEAAAPGSWQQKAAQKEADEIGAQIKAAMDKAKAQDAKQPENQGRAVLSESPEQTQLGNPKPETSAVQPRFDVAKPEAAAPFKPGDAVEYQTNKGTPRPARIVRVDGDRALVQDKFAQVWKPLAGLKPVGGEAAPAHAPVQQGQPAPGTAHPVGAPIPARVEQIKKLVATGQKVVIFSAEADNPAVHQALSAVGLGQLPVTNIKGPDFGAILDNLVNVKPDVNEPMVIPPIPAGKALYVDFDDTLFYGPRKEPANVNEPRNGGQPRADDAPEGAGRKTDAIREPETERVLQRQPQEDRAGGGGRIQPGQQGNGPAGEGAPTAGEEKPLDQQGGGEGKEEVKDNVSRAAAIIKANPDMDKFNPGGMVDEIAKQLDISRPEANRLYIEAWRKITAEKPKPSFYKPPTPQIAPMAGTSPMGAKVMDRPARTDAIGKPGVEVPAKYEPKPNESPKVTPSPKPIETSAERFKRAVQAKADKYLDTQVRRESGQVLTRRAIIDERMAGGGTTSIKQVQDDAAERKLDREIGAMRKAGVPTGNEMHPKTIKYREMLAQQKAGIKVPSYRIKSADGTEWIVSKTEYDYAQSIEGKTIPKESKPVSTPVEKPVEKEEKEYAAYIERGIKAKERDKELRKTLSEDEGILWDRYRTQGHLDADLGEALRIAEAEQKIDGAPKRTLAHLAEAIQYQNAGGLGQALDNVPESFVTSTRGERIDRGEAARKRIRDIQGAMEKPSALTHTMVGSGATAMTPEDRTAMEAKPAPAKPTFSNAARERAGLKPVTRAVVQPEKPTGTALNTYEAEVSKYAGDPHPKMVQIQAENRRHAEQLLAEKHPGMRISSAGRVDTAPKYLKRFDLGNGTEARMYQMNDGRYAVAVWDTDADKSVSIVSYPTEEQATKAFEKGTSQSVTFKPGQKVMVKGADGTEKPAQINTSQVFGGNSIASAKAKLGKIPGQTPRSIPRAPKQIDNQALIKHLESRLDEAKQDLSRANTEDKPVHQQEVESLTKELADARAEAANAPKPKSALGATFYSGFDPTLIGRMLPGASGSIQAWASGDPTPKETTKAIIREKYGEMTRRINIAIDAFKGESKRFDEMSHEEALAYMDAVEHVGGKTVADLSPQDQQVAKLIESAYAQRREKLEAMGEAPINGWIEDYLAHWWKNPQNARKTLTRLFAGKRPLEGQASFRKKRKIPTTRDGINLGLEPLTWNPIRGALMKLWEMDQFIMAHEIMNALKQAGTVHFVPARSRQPDGEAKLDDKIGTVWAPAIILNKEKLDAATYDKTYMGGDVAIPSVAREDIDDASRPSFVIVGHYYAPKDVAKVFNNFVSKGLAGRSRIYDALRWANGNLNALQLGISAWHATTTTVNAAASDIAVGIEQLSQGKPVAAGISMARAPITVKHMMANGYKITREYMSPGSYPEMEKEAEWLSRAGGRLNLEAFEPSPMREAINAYRNGPAWEKIKTTPGALLSAAIWPVLGYYVPRMKAGAFYEMAHNILNEAEEHKWTPEQIRSKMQEAWDSVDNRFGMIVYENRFWPRVGKDIAQLLLRATGYTWGDVDEYGGAARDAVKAIVNIVSGNLKKARITPKIAFAFSSFFTTAVLGTAMTFMSTGHMPTDLKHSLYWEDSSGTYHSIAGYPDQIVAFAHDPERTAINKIAPIWSAIGHLSQNQDYYRTEIRHPDDSIPMQALELAEGGLKEIAPFSISGGVRLLEEKGAQGTISSLASQAKRHPGEFAASYFGFNQAPAFIQNSEALNMAREYETKNLPPGTRTREAAARQQMKHAIENMYRTKTVDSEAIQSAITNGVVSERDRFSAQLAARENPLAAATKRLHVDQAVNVFMAASPEEQKLLRPVIETKQNEIDTFTNNPEERQKLKDAYRNALHPQPKFSTEKPQA